MGGGASTFSSTDSVLMNTSVVTMSKAMSKDESFRQSFSIFIKNGLWLEVLADYFPPGKIYHTREERLVKETGNIMYAYQLPKLKTVNLRDIGSEESKTISNRRGSNASPSSNQAGSTKNGQVVMLNIEECCIFSEENFMDILLNILFPIFLGSQYYARFAQYGAELSFEEQEHQMLLDGPPSTNKLAIRVQELLLGSAAYFDQTVIAEHLLHPEWARSIPRVMDGLSLCITLLDASLPEPQFVYANKAFTAMTGYTVSDLVNKRMDILDGKETDEYQSELINLAIQSEVLSKYAITHYNKAGKAFINMVSVKNCGQYTIVVHFQANKQSKMADLKTVDDVMVLLTCLLKPPPVSELSSSSVVAPTSAVILPSLPAILSKLASYRVTSPLVQIGKKTITSTLGNLGGSAGSNISTFSGDRMKENVNGSTSSDSCEHSQQVEEKCCFPAHKALPKATESVPFPLSVVKGNLTSFGTGLGSKNGSNVTCVMSSNVCSPNKARGTSHSHTYNVSSDSSVDYEYSDDSVPDSMGSVVTNQNINFRIPLLDFRNVRACE